MRLDVYLCENNYFDSRTKAKQAIERGEVILNGKIVNKTSLEVFDSYCQIKIIRETEFVSLGGYKLYKALNDFNLDLNGAIAADIGASTGGFTDCLLKRGVNTVYSVDLNDDLLHQKLKNDDRVIPLIKNARELVKSDFDQQLDIIVADLSFISATYVLKTFSELIDDNNKIILLIKPQFETGEKKRFKNGIIKDSKIHKLVCENIYNYAISVGLTPIGLTTAPRQTGKNLEFLMLLIKGNKEKPFDITKMKYS